MTTQFRNYKNSHAFSEDYYKVRDFLVTLKYAEYSYTRWDWMITHSYLDQNLLNLIGLWEEDGELVGLVVFDLSLGTAFCLVKKGYEALKGEQIQYAEKHLSKNGKLYLVIPDEDRNYQTEAFNGGYLPTVHKESDAIFYTDLAETGYSLPGGFVLKSMADQYDLFQYTNALWKGFDHEANGEGPLQFTKEEEAHAHASMTRPNVDLNLKICVYNGEGDCVAYSGLWYDEVAQIAYVEPVATAPDYRKMGLAKAALLEGISRVKAMGAKTVIVGSSQQFYYSIGFFPYKTSTLWVKSI